MHPNILRQKFLDFFKKRNHEIIPSSSLIPENDPTSLFNTAGMQPLVPYLLGAEHPNGSRLANSQKCVRTIDIEEVGDDTHCTFFEMLGHWSLGDYFKEESLKWSFEFLTAPESEGGLGLDKSRFCVTCFKGNKDVERDDEAIKIWEDMGFVLADNATKEDRNRIYLFDEDCWWKLAETGPCGPDSEIFYYAGDLNDPKYLNNEYYPNDETDLYVEVWNNVFMAYFRNEDKSVTPLKKKNIDTGMGFERIVSFVNGVNSPYETSLFSEAINLIKESCKEYNEKSARIIADHTRTSVFLMGEKNGVTPSNQDQGYVLRKLIRRAVRHAKKLEMPAMEMIQIAKNFIALYGDYYTSLNENQDFILNELEQEIKQFEKTLVSGEKMFAKFLEQTEDVLSGVDAFHLYDTFGFPIEMTCELAEENGVKVDLEGYEKAFQAHKDLSKANSAQKFKGGLADHSMESTKLHTATHLLHQALRNILGDHIEQKGSNITPERLRFDFNHPEAVSKEQLIEVENLVNEQIQRDLQISNTVMTVDEAKNNGAIGLFEDRYGDNVNVYRIGDFSLEICGGPHVENTGQIGKFKIKKEQSCGKGIRRIKAVISND